MEINFEYKDVTVSDLLELYTIEKLNDLDKKYNFLISADVYFKTENTTSDETGLICGIRIYGNGITFFAESNKDNFENAVSETVHQLEPQLKKKKSKLLSHY
ncbi:ribosome hibernation-promoting factor, HPF/YfiA family [Polaribacter sargassicola]|uniref:ribosome hibernation-promoting factor, HPF/YfiA family n=1 Tax=Polaribacter sargassicola TaxID=2836891 RepID=UPI001F018346|nr:ribosome-associated translation inhibitor RaiA [Polaribacter sp. DS7-9]MCG1037195.1 ribosome-associated translation inhibitor RaiA [Polaribacter sp. DS7-9]